MLSFIASAEVLLLKMLLLEVLIIILFRLVADGYEVKEAETAGVMKG